MILLVEDDVNDILLMSRAFNKARLANPLQVVHDGEEAIRYLSGEGEYADRSKHPIPFLILLDLKMPRKSGFEVLQWVRDNSELKNALVVILTASQEAPDVKRAFELGADSFLTKPAQFDDLVAMMKRLQGYWLLVDKKPDRLALLVGE